MTFNPYLVPHSRFALPHDISIDGVSVPTFKFDVVTGNTSAGSSNSDQFKLPLHTTGTYDFEVNWGDGSTDNITVWDQSEVTHTYSSGGTYRVRITGNIKKWFFNNTNDKLKMTTLYSWGPLKLGDETSSFYGTTNLTGDPTGTLDMSEATNMTNLFRASGMNFNLNNIDLSGCTAIAGFFRDCSNFNQPLDNWVIPASVTNYSSMFAGTGAFNQDISGWDVSSVTDFVSMFTGASAFNTSLDAWDVGEATSLGSMFHTSIYNQPLNSWRPAKCLTFTNLFFNSPFDQNIGDWTFATSGSITMDGMFHEDSSFDQDISSWSLGNVTNMSSMFQDATSFDQDLSSWDTGNVTTFLNMFRGTIVDFDVGGWDVTSLVDATNMFLSTTLSTSNYDALLVGWEGQSVLDNVVFHGGDSTYTDPGAPATARADLVVDHTWTITDGGAV